MSKTEFKTWDQYAEEAKLEPFKLVISKDETLVIEAPTGTALMRITQGLRNGDMELVLRALAGEQWDRIAELLSDAGHKALPALLEDLMDHFDLYEKITLIGPGGGKVTRSRPREIQAMINQGYRPAGEAPTS